MSDWTEGYFTDVGYTFGYYRELNPLHAKITLWVTTTCRSARASARAMRAEEGRRLIAERGRKTREN